MTKDETPNATDKADIAATAVVAMVLEAVCDAAINEHERIISAARALPVMNQDACAVTIATARLRIEIWRERRAIAPAIAEALRALLGDGDIKAAKAAAPDSIKPFFDAVTARVAAVTSEAPMAPPEPVIKLRVINPRNGDLHARPLHVYATALVTIGATPSNHIVAAVGASDVHATISRIGKAVWLGNLNPDGRGVYLRGPDDTLQAPEMITHTHMMRPGEWINIGDVFIALEE